MVPDKPKGSFVARLERERDDLLYLIRGNSGGRRCWYYVLIEPLKRERFLRAVKAGSLDVSDYGQILYSGFGDDPPEDVEESIRNRFG